MRSFSSLEGAEKWAELQMTYLEKDWFYSICMWDTNFSTIIPCKDKRLRLVK